MAAHGDGLSRLSCAYAICLSISPHAVATPVPAGAYACTRLCTSPFRMTDYAQQRSQDLSNCLSLCACAWLCACAQRADLTPNRRGQTRIRIRDWPTPAETRSADCVFTYMSVLGWQSSADAHRPQKHECARERRIAANGQTTASGPRAAEVLSAAGSQCARW